MKVQCACGTKYAFDVTPDMLRTPRAFVCQTCGRDNSAAINELIRQAYGVMAAPPPPPPAATASAPPQPVPAAAPPPPPPPPKAAPIAVRVAAPRAPAPPTPVVAFKSGQQTADAPRIRIQQESPKVHAESAPPNQAVAGLT